MKSIFLGLMSMMSIFPSGQVYEQKSYPSRNVSSYFHDIKKYFKSAIDQYATERATENRDQRSGETK